MLSGPSFRSTFVFSISPLILYGFPLTSFHLAEVSLSALSWLYTLACAVVQKYREMSFIQDYSISSSHFAHLENVNKSWKNNRTVRVKKRNQNKNKTKSRHIQIDHAFYCLI